MAQRSLIPLPDDVPVTPRHKGSTAVRTDGITLELIEWRSFSFRMRR